MELLLPTLSLAELAALGIEDLAVLQINPTGHLYDLVEIKNISKQLVPIMVNVDDNSPFFISTGFTRLYPGQRIAVEQDRIDLAAIRSVANKKLITYRLFQQFVGIASSGTDIGP